MPFISPAEHKKLILQCKSIVNADVTGQYNIQGAAQLMSDMAELEQLLQQYLHTIAQIPGLTEKYHLLQRRIRVSARKMQPAKRRDYQKGRKLSS